MSLFKEGSISIAQSNHKRVGKALEILNTGLKPFVEREMLAKHGTRWQYEAVRSLCDQHFSDDGQNVHLDTQGLLLILWDQWYEVFKNVLVQPRGNSAGGKGMIE